MSIRYYLQKLFGLILNSPIIPKGKTMGYSLVKSERANSTLEEHTKVYPPFFLHNVHLGAYSYIAKNSSVSNCEIGKYCSIGPNFCCGLGIHPIHGISTSPMFYSKAKQNGVSMCKESTMEESRRSVIGNDVFIGANVTVLDGVTIGDGAVIGAGAVVTKDIPPYAVAVGVPARVSKYRFDCETIDQLLQIRWWDKDSQVLEDIAGSFDSTKEFIKKYESVSL